MHGVDTRVTVPNPLQVVGSMKDNLELFKANWTSHADGVELKYNNFCVVGVNRRRCYNKQIQFN